MGKFFWSEMDYVKDEVREEASLNRATIYNYALKSKRVNMDLLIRYNTTLWKYHDLGLLAGYSGSFMIRILLMQPKRG